MANIISESTQFTTIAIHDACHDQVGTGFLVGDTPVSRGQYGHAIVSWEQPQFRAYLVTARHVLGENESEISCAHEYHLRYNGRGPDGLTTCSHPFHISNDPQNWRFASRATGILEYKGLSIWGIPT